MGFEMIGRSVLCNKLDALSETLEIEEKKIFVQQNLNSWVQDKINFLCSVAIHSSEIKGSWST